jgi:hypothetical protein
MSAPFLVTHPVIPFLIGLVPTILVLVGWHWWRSSGRS